jgi:hypothetical protein
MFSLYRESEPAHVGANTSFDGPPSIPFPNASVFAAAVISEPSIFALLTLVAFGGKTDRRGSAMIPTSMPRGSSRIDLAFRGVR